MKNYEEMAKYVLEVRDEHERKKQKRKIIVRRCAPLAVSLCVFLIASLGVWRNMPAPNKFNTDIIPSTTQAATSDSSAAKTASSASTAVTTEPAHTSSAGSTVTTPSVSSENTTLSTAASQTGVPKTTKSYTHTQTTASSEATHTSVTQTTSQQSTATSSQQTAPPATMPLTEPTTVTTTQPPAAGTDPSYAESIETLYNTAYIEELDTKYFYGCITVKEFEIESLISYAEMSGYDSDADKVVTCVAEAYRLNGTDEKKAIAIKFSGNDYYFLYCRR